MRRALVMTLLLALPAAARADSTVKVQSGPPDEAVQKLVDSERAFAHMATATNIRDAFFEYMAEDAILFRPTPVNGKEFYRARPANPGPVLAWYPSYAELSVEGDLGWTTGPWEYKSAPDKAPEAWGHFATIWQRQTNGKYRVLFDEGHSCAKPPQDSLTWARLPGTPGDDTKLLATLVGAQKQLVDTDAAYSKLLVEQGVGAALAAYADDDVRLLREDKPELTGAADAGKTLAHEWSAGVTAWDVKAGAIARSMDLAFTYGIASLGPKAKDSPNGRKVFRVWRHRPGADWKLALDVTNPLPATPAPKPAATAKKP